MRFPFPVGKQWSESFYSEDRSPADGKEQAEEAASAASTFGHMGVRTGERKNNQMTPDATFTDLTTSPSEGEHPLSMKAQPWLPAADEGLVFDMRYLWGQTSSVWFYFIL